MTVCGKPGKTIKLFSHPSHKPWKSLRDSHIPSALRLIISIQFSNQKRSLPQLPIPLTFRLILQLEKTEREKKSLVTTPGRCFSIIARRSNCHCGELVSPNLLEGTRTAFPQANAQPNPWVIRITSRADVPILSRIEPSREPSRLCGCEGRRGLFPRGFRESGSLRGAGRR